MENEMDLAKWNWNKMTVRVILILTIIIIVSLVAEHSTKLGTNQVQVPFW